MEIRNHVIILLLFNYQVLLNDEEKKKEIEYLVIGEGCCNELQMNLNICDYPNLKDLSIHNNSLNNIHSLTISNNPLLLSLFIGELTQNEIDGCVNNAKSIEISSIF